MEPKPTPESTSCVLWTLSRLHKAFGVLDLNIPFKSLILSKPPASPQIHWHFTAW